MRIRIVVLCTGCEIESAVLEVDYGPFMNITPPRGWVGQFGGDVFCSDACASHSLRRSTFRVLDGGADAA